MNTTIDKQELMEWLSELEDQAILQAIQSIKNSHTKDDWWDEIPEIAKEGIRRGETDVQAGRFHTSEEFWEEIHRRGKDRA